MATTTPTRRRLRKGFTLIELVVVIVVIALLIGLAAFGYTRFIAGSKRTTAKAVAAQVAKAIQGHSATEQLAYSVANFTTPQPTPHDLVSTDLPDGAAVGPMREEADGAELLVTLAVTYQQQSTDVVFDRGEIGTPGRVTDPVAAGSPDPDDDDETGPPAAPAGLTAHAESGTDTVTLTWGHADRATAYEVRIDGTLAETVPAPAAGTSVPGLTHGQHTVTVTAVNAAGSSPEASTTVQVTVNNDAFADAWTVEPMQEGDTYISRDTTNAGATSDAAELLYDREYGERTIWWKFTAPATTGYTVAVTDPTTGTTGSIGWNVITGYENATGPDAPLLFKAAAGTRSRHTFLGTAGTVYWFRVGNPGGNPGGALRLAVTRGFDNDMFAGAKDLGHVVAGSPYVSEDITNVGATAEAGERYGRNDGERTLWWKFTPVEGGSYTFAVIDPTTGATGSIARNIIGRYDNAASPASPRTALSAAGNRPAMTFTAVAGTTYWFQVGNEGGGPAGAFRVRLTRD